MNAHHIQPAFRTRLLVTLLAALLLGTVSACHKQADRAGELRVSGNIEATDAQLGFKIPGRVAERLVSEGQRVTVGQLIARLDDIGQRQQNGLRLALHYQIQKWRFDTKAWLKRHVGLTRFFRHGYIPYQDDCTAAYS